VACHPIGRQATGAAELYRAYSEVNSFKDKEVARDKGRLPKRSDKGRCNDQTLRGVTFVAERY